jgi:hypothetical protein
MKITFTKPDSINIVSELDKLLVPTKNRSSVPHLSLFPQVVSKGYLKVWEQFIQTQTSADLYKQGAFPEHGLYLVCSGFISYLDNQASSPYDKSKFNLLQNSKKALIHKLTGFKSDLKTFFIRKNIMKWLFVYRDHIDILTPENNDFINAFIGIRAQVTLFLAPRKKYSLSKTGFGPKSKRTDLDPILVNLKNHLYKNDLPKQLKGIKQTLNSNLTKTKYLQEHSVLKKPNHSWARIDTSGVHVLAYRAGENVLALRFVVETPVIFFSGSLRPSEALSEIKKIIKRSLPI